MERLLRRKFILVAMGVITTVLLVMATVINISSYLQVDDVADEVIAVLAENGGLFPANFDRNPFQHMTQETQFSTRYFWVRLNADGELSSVDTRNIMMVNADQAGAFAKEILDSGVADGFMVNYKYQMIAQEDGYFIIFVDCAEELSAFHSLLYNSVTVCIIAILAVFVLIVVVSKQAVAPIVESYQKQQQFITNITHELKTPLAIVKTNTEVIEMSQGSSQWSQSIHNQIRRLNELVNHLVSLCKMDEDGHQLLKVDFSLSDAISETAEPFAVMAQEKEVELVCQIAPNITCCGEEDSLRLLVSILMDNAVKYCNQTAPITVNLQQIRGKSHITISNGADDLKAGKYDQIFQRFYRLDGSRNSAKGGFGIGLAMASTIVRNHGGTMQAKSPDGKIMEIHIEL
ncbi:HAMP domain-containing sensor histidine kinase [Bengtsoniella intestinalis]|uniref:sensor histidine kinase n=1 Tax=Bengtsoniella intestinalis TaxID=3073143 RepID=UPI00391F2450